MPENEALCCTIYNTRGQRQLSWEIWAATSVAVAAYSIMQRIYYYEYYAYSIRLSNPKLHA